MRSEMSIQWSTRDAGQPQVRWGTESGHYTASSRGSSVTYTRKDLCDAPATTTGWIDPGFTQNAIMTGLEPSTRYFYSYGDEVGSQSSASVPQLPWTCMLLGPSQMLETLKTGIALLHLPPAASLLVKGFQVKICFRLFHASMKLSFSAVQQLKMDDAFSHCKGHP